MRDLLGGVLAVSVLKAVGTKQTMEQALNVVRPGRKLELVGVPDSGPQSTGSVTKSINCSTRPSSTGSRSA